MQTIQTEELQPKKGFDKKWLILVVVSLLAIGTTIFASLLLKQSNQLKKEVRILEEELDKRKNDSADLKAQLQSVGYRKESSELLETQTCNGDECLLTSGENMYGFSWLEGYYQVEKVGESEIGLFIATGGSAELFSSLSSKTPSVSGEKTIAVGLSGELTLQEKQLLEGSNSGNPIKVGVIIHPTAMTPPTHGSPAYSIVTVKNANL